jgi:predicted RNase H-like nuclease (RuvC/YqgF family)
MLRVYHFVARIAQESTTTPGEWGLIFTLLTVLGTLLNILYSNRNSLVQQQKEMIASQQAKIENLENDYQSLRNEFAVSELNRIELQGEIGVLKSKLQREKLRVKSMQKKLSRNQMRKLRKK